MDNDDREAKRSQLESELRWAKARRIVNPLISLVRLGFYAAAPVIGAASGLWFDKHFHTEYYFTTSIALMGLVVAGSGISASHPDGTIYFSDSMYNLIHGTEVKAIKGKISSLDNLPADNSQ